MSVLTNVTINLLTGKMSVLAVEQNILKPSAYEIKTSPAKIACSLFSCTDSDDGLKCAPSNV